MQDAVYMGAVEEALKNINHLEGSILTLDMLIAELQRRRGNASRTLSEERAALMEFKRVNRKANGWE
ncbi:MAG: hypothetical protein GY832_44585 [Chloroflexi bacterium]|nr:hypothetical protein [Chloroflexota bacterium]